MEPIELIQKTLIWLKENPDRWIKYESTDGKGNYCAMGAMGMVVYGDYDSFDSPLGSADFNCLWVKCKPYVAEAGNELYGFPVISTLNDICGYNAVIEVFELALKKAVKKTTEKQKELVKV